ncbi:MAG TPA: hypothetical protein DD412_07980 [Holosporales bacterium]|nr:hypothetical protein [Holosporales bacterium]
MKYYSKPMLFFCLAIHMLAQNTHASLQGESDVELNEPPKTGTVCLHFSHKKSPAIREMGYCQISIYENKTETFHNFPPLNIHTRSPNTSPREMIKKKMKEIKEKSLTEKKQPKKFGRPLPKPQYPPQSYEKDYEIPLKLLEPGNYLCLSFFIDSIYLPRHGREYVMLPWQDLKDIALLELSLPLKNGMGERLMSLSLGVDWNNQPLSWSLEEFDMDRAVLQELRSATTFVSNYEKSPPSKKAGIKKFQRIKAIVD